MMHAKAIQSLQLESRKKMLASKSLKSSSFASMESLQNENSGRSATAAKVINQWPAQSQFQSSSQRQLLQPSKLVAPSSDEKTMLGGGASGFLRRQTAPYESGMAHPQIAPSSSQSRPLFIRTLNKKQTLAVNSSKSSQNMIANQQPQQSQQQTQLQQSVITKHQRQKSSSGCVQYPTSRPLRDNNLPAPGGSDYAHTERLNNGADENYTTTILDCTVAQSYQQQATNPKFHQPISMPARRKSTSSYLQKGPLQMAASKFHKNQFGGTSSTHSNKPMSVNRQREAQNSKSTMQTIQQTKANIEKMRQEKEQNAALFSKKLKQLHAQDSIVSDDIDEMSNVQWQLSLRERRFSGTGRSLAAGPQQLSGPQTCQSHHQTHYTSKQQQMKGARSKQAGSKRENENIAVGDEQQQRRKEHQAEPAPLNSKSRQQQMFHQAIISQKQGDGGEDIFMTTGVEESHIFHEQTSLQKSVYNQQRIRAKEADVGSISPEITNASLVYHYQNSVEENSPLLTQQMKPSQPKFQNLLRDALVLTPEVPASKRKQSKQSSVQQAKENSNEGVKLFMPTNKATRPVGASRNTKAKGYLIPSTHFRNCSQEHQQRLKNKSLRISVTLEEPQMASKATQNLANSQSKTKQSNLLISQQQSSSSHEQHHSSVFLEGTMMFSNANNKDDGNQKVENNTASTPKQGRAFNQTNKFDFMQQICKQGGILQHSRFARDKSTKTMKEISQPNTNASSTQVNKTSMAFTKVKLNHGLVNTDESKKQQRLSQLPSQKYATSPKHKQTQQTQQGIQSKLAATQQQKSRLSKQILLGGSGGSKAAKQVQQRQSMPFGQTANITTRPSLKKTGAATSLNIVSTKKSNAMSPRTRAKNTAAQKFQKIWNKSNSNNISVSQSMNQLDKKFSTNVFQSQKRQAHQQKDGKQEEPVPEIVNSSLASTPQLKMHVDDDEDDADAVIVEERPLKEIIQTSQKFDSVKKDLTFNKQDMDVLKVDGIHGNKLQNTNSSGYRLMDLSDQFSPRKITKQQAATSCFATHGHSKGASINPNDYKDHELASIHSSGKKDALRTSRDHTHSVHFSPLIGRKQVKKNGNEAFIGSSSVVSSSIVTSQAAPHNQISKIQSQVMMNQPRSKNLRFTDRDGPINDQDRNVNVEGFSSPNLMTMQDSTMQPGDKQKQHLDNCGEELLSGHKNFISSDNKLLTILDDENLVPNTARSSSSRPLQAAVMEPPPEIESTNGEESSTTTAARMAEAELIEKRLVFVGQPQLTAFEQRQEKAMIRWNYLFSFIQKCRLAYSQGKLSTKEKLSRTPVWDQFYSEFNADREGLQQDFDEQMQKKMLDQIHLLSKRCEDSEFGASNFTQITDYQIGKHLGSGAYASVKMATHRPTGLVLAIKVYEKFKLNEQSQRKVGVKREIAVMKKLQHQNIMRMYDVIDSPKQLYIVLEFIQGQMLHSYIEKLLLENNLAEFTLSPASVRPRINAKRQEIRLNGPILDNAPKKLMAEPTVAIILHQVLQALAFAHSKHVCHRDLKPENIMYNPRTHQVKIIDFGFACISKEKLRVFCGTPSYMSPEIVNKKDYIGAAADVWACGVLLFVMLTGQVPFKSTTEKDLYRKISKGVYSFGKQETKNQNVTSSFSMQPTTMLPNYTNIPGMDTYMANRPEMQKQQAIQLQQLQDRSAAFTPSVAASVEMPSTGLNEPVETARELNGGTNSTSKHQLNQQKQVSREAKDLVRQMLTIEQEQRPTAAHLLKSNGWLRKNTAFYTE